MEFLSKEGRDLLEKGIRRLKPRYSQVLHLHSAREMSAKEAARFLELPVGTVKARLHRARAKLTRHAQSILKLNPTPIRIARQRPPLMPQADRHSA